MLCLINTTPHVDEFTKLVLIIILSNIIKIELYKHIGNMEKKDKLF